MKRHLGDRWIDYVMHQSLKVPGQSFLCLVVAAIAVGVFVVTLMIYNRFDGTSLIIGITWLILALVAFERRRFAQIIQQQRIQIAELETQIHAQETDKLR